MKGKRIGNCTGKCKKTAKKKKKAFPIGKNKGKTVKNKSKKRGKKIKEKKKIRKEEKG